MNTLEKDKSKLIGLVNRELIASDLDLSALEPSAREWYLGYWRALDLVERDIASYSVGNVREYLAQEETEARNARDAIDPEATRAGTFTYEYADGYHRALIRLKAKLNALGGN